MLKTLLLLFTCLRALNLTASEIPFPSEDVLSILSKTPNEIILFARTKEIELFKFYDPIPSESKDTATIFLSLIPEVKYSDFKNVNDLFSGNVLGIYFSKHSSLVELQSDTILFSEFADRWTIIHEFAHALIDKKRLEEEKKDERSAMENIRNAKEDYEEIMSAYRSLGFFPSTGHVRRALSSIQTWCELMINFMYTYELEEVRIEKFIQDIFTQKPEYKLDANTFKRSFWYVGKNCQTAISKMNHSIEVLAFFESIIPKKMELELRSEIDAYKMRLLLHKNYIDELCVQ